MRESHVEFKVGLLVATAAVLFGGFLFVLGNCSLSDGYTVYVDYDFSGNVQPGAPVKVSGIKVGRVEEVEFLGGEIDKATGRRVQVRVELWIEERARNSVRRDSEFFINTAGVLGEQYVEIVPGTDWDAPPIAPGEILIGVNPPRTDLVVARLYELLDIMTAVLREDRDKITHLLKNGANAVDEVNKILAENRAHIGELIVAVTDVAKSSRTTLDKVNRGLDPAMVASILSRTDKLLDTTDQTIAGVAPKAGRFLDDATRVTGLVTEPRLERALGAVDHAAGAAEQAEALLTNANGLVKDLRAGKGTAGALLTRTEVYTDIRELIRDLRKNPWKVLWKE